MTLPGQIINAAGTLTRLSGAPLAPGVAEAMVAADAVSVDMVAFHAYAGEKIAAATGAESGLATAGASAGLLLAAAACLARDDIARMNALPGGRGPSEIVVARSHRNSYDHAARVAGATLVEVGLPDPTAEAGRRDVEPWEVAAALGPDTAAVYFTATRATYDLLPAVVEVAHAQAVPVIVDAAAELPPAANLHRFIADGADLVAFSGGKVLGGPAGTGMLAGRRDLIASAALQCLDLDVHASDFAPPPDFIDMTRYAGLPRHGVGRSAKLGKHEIAGLLAALDCFLSEPDADRHARWLTVCERVAGALGGATIAHADDTDRIPVVELAFPDAAAARVRDAALRARALPVHLGTDPFRPSVLSINPVCLREADIGPLLAALTD
ncbi:aminotransferase class V-fold PLP-dependent enzyme [Psychromarinibacter sp. S121]|uniref:aminotransferase class V-fold PLP-dependent enzyme n=1 Tax=Psychromarinibacter sp. S121 TaxID=3415127 RepID=UPI003C79ED00